MNTKRNRRSSFARTVPLTVALASGIGTAAFASGQSASESSPVLPGSSYLTVGLLDRIPLSVLFALMVVVVLGSIWSGLLAGARRRRKSQHEGEGPVGTAVGAILGLLAFTLAFTFGIASNRFDLRKQVLLDEAESIGTTYLRAGMIPRQQGDRIRQDLREYVDLRVEAAQHPQRLPAMLARSQQLHDAMWAEATALVATGHSSPVDALFIDSLNRTIDLHTHRAAISLHYRIPDTVWIVLLALSVVGMTGVGYLFGLSGSSSWPVSFALAVAFSTVIMVTADLDRSTSGTLRVSQGAMIELRRTMHDAVPEQNPKAIAPSE